MQISLYIGERKKKDKIVNEELLKYVEGDRSDRIKDLILKGLIFEGKTGIEEKLLDMRYMYNNSFVTVTKEEDSVTQVIAATSSSVPDKDRILEEIKPDFSNIKVEKKEIVDDDLEERI
ncbi:hypothetical protein GOM49_00755 [Clostridium bovifaecis]|uniref:Uncharacterized protein n=1 Tax=Clostridium bovifaecis TaxID=2184719 RepID=A0A6I6F0H3_9CLOT|nr:hypothetical protein GOM49_00755 [Clostridium bovifaecis]